jgi:hypothetical protein
MAVEILKEVLMGNRTPPESSGEHWLVTVRPQLTTKTLEK